MLTVSIVSVLLVTTAAQPGSASAGESDGPTRQPLALEPYANGAGSGSWLDTPTTHEPHIPAAPGDPGSVGGTVTLGGNAAAAGCVDAYDPTYEIVGTDCADGSGEYLIEGLAPGSYYLRARDFTGAAIEWSGGGRTFSSATAAVVTSDVTTDYDFTLEAGGSIAGTMLPSFTVPFPVTLYVETTEGEVVTWIEHDGNSPFAIAGVPSGAYRLFADFTDHQADTFYVAAGEITPGLIGVTAPATTSGIDIFYSQYGHANVVGVLSIPQNLGSSTLCVAAYKRWTSAPGFAFERAYCGAPGAFFRLDGLEYGPASYYTFVVAGAIMTTDAQWRAYSGPKYWVGSDGSYANAYTYEFPSAGTFWMSLLQFYDVPLGSQFYDDISWMVAAGITTGYDDGSFRPTASVSRQAMAAFMYRFAGEPDFTPPAESPFSDVPTTSQFYKEITWMANEGISTGYDDDTFRPQAAVSRQAMAAFMYRFAGEPAFTPPGVSPFSDVPTGGQFYLPITWMADTGISTGYDGGTFRPGASVSRQAIAAFMHRLYDQP